MSLPFAVEQFLGVFVAYNAAIWPEQIAAYTLGRAPPWNLSVCWQSDAAVAAQPE